MPPRLHRVAVPLLTACLLTLATACGGGGGDTAGTAAKPGEKIKLTVGLFGDFGFKPLYEEYRKTHPNIEITENVTQFNDHHNNLVKRLATNAGADDIEAVEVGYISTFTAQPAKFYDLKQYGLDKRQGEYLDWKWQQGLSKQGGQLLGLGTDVGGLAMCYRKDLFAKAGLPTDRTEVAALWPTWEKYIETGRKFAAAGVAGAKFVDSPGEIFRAMVNQAPTGLYDDQDQIIVGSNPAVKQAWDLSNQLTSEKLTAKLAAFTPPWNTGFAKGSFATIICPAWMTGFIQEQAKDAAGKWDIATVPGGSGNSGGSHLMIPRQSKHPKEAAELIDFLTSKENQAKVFKEEGTFPSIPALYDDPSIQSFTKPFFGDAPIGKIYSAAAKALKPQHLGPKEAEVRVAIGNGLGRVEQGKQTPDQAWAQVLEDVKKIK
ncbi:ABC transporter substrate-binding protein [Nonomuraea roseoviolacea subsp. roseoviolacea]|uniref:Cellobiose transport system substrate-binding protein n=1 Tax=Nonomuraea roseoviolacea subsp. carminata TaxID=160689 RepID=A0ABT1JVR5_9ACTN|nr:extracellular solute-binding protein [Nonomuraea roseoviolacea]MCP2345492.1 cellobiose transport system substrate-binding protein [Nonomuraea roseoviolacea subsp. carminata]